MSRTFHASRDARRTERAARAAELELIERAWIAVHGNRYVETHRAQQAIAAKFVVGTDGKLERVR